MRLGIWIGLALLTTPSSALAQDTERGTQPVRYSLRPLTLPEMTLMPELGLSGTHVDVGPVNYDAFVLGAGASFGVFDDFMVETIPASVLLGDPEVDYAYFLAGATYRFVDGPVEFGGRFRFAVSSEPDLYFNLGLPVRIRTDIVRVDTGLEMMVVVPDEPSLLSDGDPAVGLRGLGQLIDTPRPGIPAEVALQLIDPIWLGLNTGFGLADFGEAGDTVFVPLGWGAGATIPSGDSPAVDLALGFTFPLFLWGGADEQPVTQIWQLGFTAKDYFYL